MPDPRPRSFRTTALLGAAVLALAVVAGACGDDSDSDEAATLSDAPDTTDAQNGNRADGESVAGGTDLEGKLLEVSDLPSGWTVSTEGDDQEESADDEAGFCEEAFAGFDELEGDDGPQAEVEFQKGEPSIMGGVFLTEALSTGDEDELVTIFDRLPAAFEKCREFDDTDEDGSTFSGSFSPLSFERYGDDTFAMHMSAQANSDGFEFPLAGDFVFVRDGNLVMSVAIIGFGAAGVPAEELEQVVQAGFNKL